MASECNDRKASRQAIERGLAEELQKATNQDLILRLPINNDGNKDVTVFATQERLIAAQKEFELCTMGGTAQPF